MTKRTAVLAAIATPDYDVPEENTRYENALSTHVAALEVGEVASRTRMLDGDMPLCEYEATLPELRRAARNNAAPAVKRAKNEIPGADYRIEIRDIMLQAGGGLVTCVTRVR